VSIAEFKNVHIAYFRGVDQIERSLYRTVFQKNFLTLY